MIIELNILQGIPLFCSVAVTFADVSPPNKIQNSLLMTALNP